VPALMRSDKPDKTVGVYLQAFNRKL